MKIEKWYDANGKHDGWALYINRVVVDIYPTKKMAKEQARSMA